MDAINAPALALLGRPLIGDGANAQQPALPAGPPAMAAPAVTATSSAMAAPAGPAAITGQASARVPVEAAAPAE